LIFEDAAMSRSTIAKIEIFKLNIRLATPYRIALGMIETADNLLVRIHTSDGLYGLGEGSPISYIAGETQGTCFATAVSFARLLIGKDATDVEARLRELDAFLTHNRTAKSAFDMALYDLLGKRAGLPLYALFGGARRMVETDWTIGIDTPEAMAKKALEIQAKGFSAIKLKLGVGWAEDVARVRAVREAVGPEPWLRLDANQGWDAAEALHILQAMAPHKVQYCEQPIVHWNEAGLRRLRQASPIPVVADESLFTPQDAFRLASAEVCDYFNIKLSKAGGLHAALNINAIAEAAGMRCLLGSMNETRLGLTAAAHLASARPNIAFTDLDTAFFHADDPVSGGIYYEGNRIIVPETPGLGADIPPEVLRGLESVSLP
jgi:L-alanine-DL-glutamate epimerase-like enolase superfamily enzyme